MAGGVEVRSSPIHGVGVFATRRCKVGERVRPIDDSRIVTDDAPLDPEKGEYDRHQDYLGTHDVLMQEPERHINHCCEPNVYVKTFDGVRWVIAYRDIEVGDEIAYDYCINSYGDDEWDCSCGHLRCCRTHNTDFLKLPDPKLVEYLPLLDEWYVEWRRESVLELRDRLGRSSAAPP
jgi:SET domain-containing protein